MLNPLLLTWGTIGPHAESFACNLVFVSSIHLWVQKIVFQYFLGLVQQKATPSVELFQYGVGSNTTTYTIDNLGYKCTPWVNLGHDADTSLVVFAHLQQVNIHNTSLSRVLHLHLFL